ncbi:type III secretion protein HrpF [Pseudomonas yamanorum]|uniref:type III secretion protein HrpF n=1 Tax=Pseudomonas yamanorum TaxID=515393 RepID=UPI00087A7666|nr:type III secretion protein HrpF [Pseudomonas yamanorum]SDT99646.1 HrpF protein [Pseudomonas yamanorum]
MYLESAATQRAIDRRFERNYEDNQRIALEASNDGMVTLQDMADFLISTQNLSSSTFAVNQHVRIQHNLTKAIIDAIP